MTIHLVNLTNPMMMKGPIRELYPVGPVNVSLRLPNRQQPQQTRLLVAKTDVKSSAVDGVLSVALPSITDHEVVAITF